MKNKKKTPKCGFLTQQSNLDHAFIEKPRLREQEASAKPTGTRRQSFKRQSVLAFLKASGRKVQSPTRRYSWTGEVEMTVDRKVLLEDPCAHVTSGPLSSEFSKGLKSGLLLHYFEIFFVDQRNDLFGIR